MILVDEGVAVVPYSLQFVQLVVLVGVQQLYIVEDGFGAVFKGNLRVPTLGMEWIQLESHYPRDTGKTTIFPAFRPQ